MQCKKSRLLFLLLHPDLRSCWCLRWVSMRCAATRNSFLLASSNDEEEEDVWWPRLAASDSCGLSLGFVTISN